MPEIKGKTEFNKRYSYAIKGLLLMDRESYVAPKKNPVECKEGKWGVNRLDSGWLSCESAVSWGKSKVIFDCDIDDNNHWDITKKPAPVKEISIEDKFYVAAKNWKKETSIYSFGSRKITNKHYVNIIGLGVVYGEPIIKIILEDLKNGTEFWHYALKKITNTNPVPKGDVNNLQKVRAAWLAWGEEKNLI